MSRPIPGGLGGLARGSPGPHPAGSPGLHPGGLQAHTRGVYRPTLGGGGSPGYCCGQDASYWNAFLLLEYYFRATQGMFSKIHQFTYSDHRIQFKHFVTFQTDAVPTPVTSATGASTHPLPQITNTTYALVKKLHLL